MAAACKAAAVPSCKVNLPRLLTHPAREVTLLGFRCLPSPRSHCGCCPGTSPRCARAGPRAGGRLELQSWGPLSVSAPLPPGTAVHPLYQEAQARAPAPRSRPGRCRTGQDEPPRKLGGLPVGRVPHDKLPLTAGAEQGDGLGGAEGSALGSGSPRVLVRGPWGRSRQRAQCSPAQPAPLPPVLLLSSILLSRSSLDAGFTLISGNFGITPKKYMYILGKKKGEEKSRAFVPHSCCHAVANLHTGIKCLPLIKQPVVPRYRHGPAEAGLFTLEIIWFLRSCLS